MQHWIFDLDGTLVHSAPSYRKIVAEVVTEYGGHLTDEQIHLAPRIMPLAFLSQVLGEEQAAPAFKKVVDMSLERISEVPAFDGVEELLVYLQSRGCVISVLTARERLTAMKIIEATGLGKYFSHVITRDCIANGKPHPEGIHHLLGQSQVPRDRAVMIGDHEMDINYAKSAGVTGISVSWDGLHSAAKDISDLHFTNFADLHSWAIEQVGP